MKTYVLTVSTVFPTTHKRKGEQTFFKEKINEALIPISETPILGKKIHTIRSNYPLWEKRINEVQEGKAILSLRYWSGKPYNSKQIEFFQLDKMHKVGIQKITFQNQIFFNKIDGNENSISFVALNDGLNMPDFMEWFKNYDLSKPMAIIHFTKFRY